MNQYQAELYHHGIKGQKWGVRRFQNSDGTLTAAGKKRYGADDQGNLSKKGLKKWYKDSRNDLLNETIDYDDEFDKTSEGKKILSEYKKQIDKMYRDDWEDDGKLEKAEEAYLRKQAEYSAKKLIKKYGNQRADMYANRGRMNSGKNAVDAMSDEWWIHRI